MKKKIKSYLVFTPFVYRIVVFIVIPVLSMWLGVYAVSRFGEMGELRVVPAVMLLTLAEIISDNWLFSGIQAKESEKMDFLKTSGRGMEMMQNALILDLLRKFLTVLAVITVCYLLSGMSGGLLYVVLVSYTVSALGTFLSRYGGTLWINVCIGQFAMALEIVCLLCVFLSGLSEFMAAFDLLFLVFGILISVLIVRKAMQKVKGGYYDR